LEELQSIPPPDSSGGLRGELTFVMELQLVIVELIELCGVRDLREDLFGLLPTQGAYGGGEYTSFWMILCADWPREIPCLSLKNRVANFPLPTYPNWENGKSVGKWENGMGNGKMGKWNGRSGQPI
jgi:hypothetical protein